MRRQTLLIVVLALAFGGIAAAGVLLFSNREPAQGAEKGTIVLAKTKVPRGETLTAEFLIAREYPKDLIPEGVVTSIEDAVGRSTLTPLFENEPILEAKLAPKGAGRGLASLIKKGMRAISIPTPSVATGVAGFIVPGSRVDIYWTSQEASREERLPGFDAPLLENVEVLAVDEKIDAPASNRMDAIQVKSVTIQVKPEEAGKLTPVLSKGTIYLSLRNPGDDGRADRPVAPTPLASPKRTQVVAASPPPPPQVPRTIRTLRGTREGAFRFEPLAIPVSSPAK